MFKLIGFYDIKHIKFQPLILLLIIYHSIRLIFNDVHDIHDDTLMTKTSNKSHNKPYISDPHHHKTSRPKTDDLQPQKSHN